MSVLDSSQVTLGQDILATHFNNLRKDVLVCGGDYVVSTGSANAYVVAIDAQITAYEAGLTIKFKANFANTGACTVNVNTIGATAIKDVSGNEISPSTIRNGQVVILTHDGTNFQLMSKPNNSFFDQGIFGLPAPWFWDQNNPTDTMPYYTDNTEHIPNAYTTSLTMYHVNSAPDIRAITSDWAAADAIRGVAVIGDYLYVLLRDNGAPLHRVYRYDKDDLAAGGTQMTYAGFGTTDATYMFTDGTYLFFTKQAGNTANDYDIRRLTINGTTLDSASDFALAGTPSFGGAIGANTNYIYVSTATDYFKYNFAGTQQSTSNHNFGATTKFMAGFGEVNTVYGLNDRAPDVLYKLYL